MIMNIEELYERRIKYRIQLYKQKQEIIVMNIEN